MLGRLRGMPGDDELLGGLAAAINVGSARNDDSSLRSDGRRGVVAARQRAIRRRDRRRALCRHLRQFHHHTGDAAGRTRPRRPRRGGGAGAQRAFRPRRRDAAQYPWRNFELRALWRRRRNGTVAAWFLPVFGFGRNFLFFAVSFSATLLAAWGMVLMIDWPMQRLRRNTQTVHAIGRGPDGGYARSAGRFSG